MGIISAMYAGVSGIKSFSTAIQVIGNNLANINTVGFKASRTEFGDLLSQGLTGIVSSSQLGRGTRVLGITRLISQGSFTTTDVNTDVAIGGNGWFQLTDGARNYYTRDGQFRVDQNGYLVNGSGYRVIGYQYTPTGEATTSTGQISLSNLITNPNKTSEVVLSANLDANSAVPTAPWDAQNPTDTSNFSTSIRVYDSLGASHEVAIFFRKTSDLHWDWHALVDSSEINGGVNTWTECSHGSLVFNATGALDQEATTTNDFDFVGGATQSQQIAFDFGDSITTDSGTGLTGITQFAAQSVVGFQTQDGYAAGKLMSVAIDPSGVISGLFSNGRTRDVAQLCIASFVNDTGLETVGNNIFVETPLSGQPTVLQPGTGAAGSVTANALELANVDMANEFVNMIQNQRAYQANTRIVTVGDQLLSETVNLVR